MENFNIVMYLCLYVLPLQDNFFKKKIRSNLLFYVVREIIIHILEYENLLLC